MSAERPHDPWVEERRARDAGHAVVAGVDEAGRGPIAGPVVAAAVVLPFGCDLAGVRDSKKLTARSRDRAFESIQAAAAGVGIGIVGVEEIDRINILRATHLAMGQAIRGLPVTPSLALVDGLPVPTLPVPQRAIVKGDALSISIGAASIIAKVTRDRIMQSLDQEFPGYGFAEHNGYPTPAHLERLRELGPCACHRLSFGPVAELTAQPTLAIHLPAPTPPGRRAEDCAADWLRTQGWTIRQVRWRAPHGEVDIIAREGDTLVFVEVKATLRAGLPSTAERVDQRKRDRLTEAAETYVAQHAITMPCRFDIIEVGDLARALPTFVHMRDAFRGGD